MPEISRFYGIRILMYRESEERHQRQHFHAVYGEHAAVFDVRTGEILAGAIPSPQRRLVERWRAMHTSELVRLWNRLCAGESGYRIVPLP